MKEKLTFYTRGNSKIFKLQMDVIVNERMRYSMQEVGVVKKQDIARPFSFHGMLSCHQLLKT